MLIFRGHLMPYFGYMNAEFKPSSLWAIYSMLRSTIGVKHNINIANYRKLLAFLKRQSSGHKSEKSKTRTAAEVNKFIKETPNLVHLFTKAC